MMNNKKEIEHTPHELFKIAEDPRLTPVHDNDQPTDPPVGYYCCKDCGETVEFALADKPFPHADWCVWSGLREVLDEFDRLKGHFIFLKEEYMLEDDVNLVESAKSLKRGLLTIEKAEKFDEIADELEAHTGNITGDYQEVIDEICRRTGGVFRWIAKGFWWKEPRFFTDEPGTDSKTWRVTYGNGSEFDRTLSWVAEKLNCKITITETCDWDKSLREARVKI